MAGEVLWRDTALTPKIFILDARAVFPIALWLFHWAYWTACVAGIAGLGLVHGGAAPGRPVTASLGVGAMVAHAGDDVRGFVEAVDQVLYAAKRNGRNRIETL